MKKFLILMQLFFSTAFFASAQVQTEISQDELARIYEEVKTPYKYGMVIAPQDNGHKIDCPTVFREGDSWYMTYVVYNGKGWSWLRDLVGEKLRSAALENFGTRTCLS